VNIDADLEAIDELRRRGADLSQGHELFNYFLCRGEDCARHLANWITVWGYQARVMPPRGTHGWEVRAAVTMEPTPDNVLNMRREMEGMARRAGAEYDGWDIETPRRI
jgi:hypothetical protein